jgi:L-iditol 2-dehydrogenase
MTELTGQRIVFPGPGEVAIEEFAVPDPGPGEILVRARHSLISAGTELTNLTDALGIAEYPLYPGYSHVGEVIARGDGAPAAFPIGGPVLSMGPHSSHLILEPAATTSPGEHIAGNQFALPIPPGIDLTHATFAVLGSVAMHAVRKARPELGQSAAVFGQGVVGQLIVQLARAAGCRPVIALDLDDARLALARESGATATVNPNDEDAVERLFELTDGRGIDLLFDATRTPATLPVMLKAAARSARVLVTGSLPGKVEIDLFHELQVREISIIGVFQPAAPIDAHPYNPWTQYRNRAVFLDRLAAGDLRVEHLISSAPSHREAPSVYRAIQQGPSDWLGIVFDWT